jgi:hypothetical protein
LNEPAVPANVQGSLMLSQVPLADTGRYDSLRGTDVGAASHA